MAKHAADPKMNRSAGGGVYVLSLVMLLAAALLYFAARSVPGFAQWYSVTVYPWLVMSLGRASGLAGFSIAEMLCAILPVLIILDIIINRRRLSRVLRRIVLLVSFLILLYSANCGVNYYRDTFVPAEKYEEAAFTEEDLIDYCNHVIVQLDNAYDPQGDMQEYPEGAELAEGARAAMTRLSEEYEGLAGYYPRPKQLSFMSGLFSSMGVSGIYSPFTIEANVNGQMRGMEKPFTACHELSHLRGYMNEGEANYIGWLACIGSDDPAFRRSGWLIAWSHAGSSLRRTDPDKFAELYARIPEEAAEELAANHEFWVSHETKASEIQDRVNDAYLKSNGLTDGIVSYGRLTTLMLMWYQDNH